MDIRNVQIDGLEVASLHLCHRRAQRDLPLAAARDLDVPTAKLFENEDLYGQGVAKAVLDTGATESVAGVEFMPDALEDRPRFRFGNGAKQRTGSVQDAATRGRTVGHCITSGGHHVKEPQSWHGSQWPAPDFLRYRT